MTAIQYQRIVDQYIKKHNIKLLGYYKIAHGSAWVKEREIKIPKPVNEHTFYLCLHEIGHIASNVEPAAATWLHEYSATKFALDEAKKLNIEFSKELYKCIKHYMKHSLIKSFHKIDSIPDKVFKQAGCSKSYWKKMKEKGKRPDIPCSINSFLEWGNARVCWSEYYY